MNNSRMRGFIVYTWLFSGVIGLEWTTGTIPDNTNLYQCEGQNVTLFWNFAAGVGEHVESIKWYFKPQDHREILIAIKTDDYFAPTSRGSQRLFHDENARLTISSLKSSDFGKYVVRVFVRKNEAATAHSRAATIALPVPPVIANDKLTMRLLPEPVLQGSTGKWQVQLACGSFVDIGKPESDVVWETPWNKEIQSTQREKDIFILTIPNPVQTGNYICKLRVSNNTERCGGISARLQRTAVFELHATDAKLMILNAENQALQKETQNLKAEINVLRQDVSASKDKLSALEGRVGSEIKVVRQDVSASKDKLSALEGRVGSEIKGLSQTVSASKDKLSALEGRVGSEIKGLSQTVSTSKDKLSALEGRVGTEIKGLSQAVSTSKDKLSALEGRVGCQTGSVKTTHSELSSGQDRTTNKRISFNKRFAGTPTVSASLNFIDSSKDGNLRLYARVSSVDSSGFTLTVGEWDNTYVYDSSVSWIACPSY